MASLEQVARSKGWGGAFENNQIWNSIKGKRPNEVIPHATSMLNEMGQLPAILSFFTGKGK